MKKILIYGLDETTADLYQNIATGHDIAMVIVGDTALDVKVNKLFEITDDLDTYATAFPDSYMIMQEIEVNELLTLLRQFRDAGREFEGIKVMRTGTNEGWTLRALLTEAAREQKLTQKVLVLQELIKSCNSLDLSEMEPKARQSFREAIMEGFVLLQQGKYEEQELDRTIQVLTEGLRQARKLYN